MKCTAVTALFLAFLAGAPVARADETPSPSGKDMVRRVPTAAALDGSWSLITQYQSILIDRGLFSSGWARGLGAHVIQKVLYGTTWTALVGGEALIVLAASHDMSWIGGARYRTDWMIPFDLPTCSHPGANGGCGLGQGGFAYLQLRPKDTHWWLEVGGGSFDQRVLDDALRELGETTWLLTPLTALYEMATPTDWPIATNWQIGPGLFGGMLNASMQPTTKGQDVYRSQPWTQIYPLYGGVGPGARTELSLVLFQHVALDGDLTIAPLLLGGAGHPSANVAPLDGPRSGFPTWRKLDFGIGYQDYRNLPFKPAFEFFGAELSSRRVDKVGYRGAMMRFDIPLR